MREIQKIEAPHPLKGKKYRGVSWKLVEILDRVEAGAKSLDDSDRHTLSKGAPIGRTILCRIHVGIGKRGRPNRIRLPIFVPKNWQMMRRKSSLWRVFSFQD